MTFHPPSDSDALRLVDLTAEELRLYEILLRQPDSALQELVAGGWVQADAERVLRAIERKGLASRSLQQPPRYRATPPDVCLGPLVGRQQRGVQSARRLLERLGAIRPRSEVGYEEVQAEIVTGQRSLAQAMERLYASAQEEVLRLERSPYVDELTGQGEQNTPPPRQGVRCRTILDTDALAAPGRQEQAHVQIGRGEEIRIGSGVPAQVLIVDRRVALVPLHVDCAAQVGLLLHPSRLFDAVHALFELLWKQAVSFGADDARDRMDKEVQELVAVLSTGSKDKVAASQLGLSARTLERRVQDMYQHLHARSRFQAGWNAALRSLENGPGRKSPGSG
ncbi:hypothetical protein [Dokdonella sp.]|uniref:TrmB family transcriptional regulator n=1 Tax=Dokdonella sp. TaxID=2291710 RepID=UPI001B17F49E|nr:hypothetical protein [Dokdonella sp.]MBO9664199.1 hypothetical protein [Dokdonella sp.]